jgi:low affinity Fe/Cu permease
MRAAFRRFANGTSDAVGSVWAFLAALALIAVWALAGPLLHYSDLWQLTINTATTVITFLMVFLIQATQNRDAKSIELKLDELIRAVAGARTKLVRLEDMSDDEIEALRKEFEHLHKRLSKDEGFGRLEREAAERQEKSAGATPGT